MYMTQKLIAQNERTMIDIVDIKSAVKQNKIDFYIEDDNIYCKDLLSGEKVKVGNLMGNEQPTEICKVNWLPCSHCTPCCGSKIILKEK